MKLSFSSNTRDPESSIRHIPSKEYNPLSNIILSLILSIE